MSNRTPSPMLAGDASSHSSSAADLEGALPESKSISEKDARSLSPAGVAASKELPNDDASHFEVKFTGDDDPRNPKSMSTLHKWIIVLIVSSTSLCVACTSSLYTGTYAQVMAEFGSNETITTLGLSMFVVGLGLSPMILAPLSEVSLPARFEKDDVGE